jgi:hypothetical protein
MTYPVPLDNPKGGTAMAAKKKAAKKSAKKKKC